MVGAAEALRADVEKLVRDDGVVEMLMEAAARATTEGVQAGRSKLLGWTRSCLEAVRKLRLTADMAQWAAGRGRAIEVGDGNCREDSSNVQKK